MSLLSVSDVVKLIPGVKPRDISDLFYNRALPGADDECPVVAGRRLIPETYVETIRLALRRAGKLPSRREVAHAAR